MTQEDAAEHIGVTVEFYARIERGNALPGMETFVCMAIAFQVGADVLLGLAVNEEAQQILKEFAAKQTKDPPKVRRTIRKLRQAAKQSGLDIVSILYALLIALEKFGHNGDESSADDDDDDDDIRDQVERMPTSDDLVLEDEEDEDDEDDDDDESDGD